MTTDNLAQMRYSIEVFPPRAPDAERRLDETLSALAPLRPEFVSVTFAAGGASADALERAVATIARVKRKGLEPAAHLTCGHAGRGATLEAASRFEALGVRRIVALRGDDIGAAAPADAFQSTAGFVAALKATGAFRIAVAAYPDPHPKSPSADADCDALARKFDAGADEAITQLFFDAERFLRLRDRLAARGIHKPLIPGVLPIVDFEQARRFARRCGVQMPVELIKGHARAAETPGLAELYLLSYTLDMIDNLAEEGVAQTHLYTLNQHRLPKQMIELCRLAQPERRAALRVV